MSTKQPKSKRKSRSKSQQIVVRVQKPKPQSTRPVPEKHWVDSHSSRQEVQRKALPLYPSLLLRSEKWLLSVLAHVYDPLCLFNPPGVDFSGLAGAYPMLVPTPVKTNVTGHVVSPFSIAEAEGSTFTAPYSMDMPDYKPYRPLSYIRTAGQARTTYTLTGTQGMIIAVNPYDFTFPISINHGDASDNGQWWCGGLYEPAGINNYPLTQQGVSDALHWDNSPFIIPSNYTTLIPPLMPSGGMPSLLTPSAYSQPAEPYPAIRPTDGEPIELYKVYANSYLAFCMRCRVTVSINRTAFTGTSIRVRTAESFLDGTVIDRLRSRIEDPSELDYGYYQAPTSAVYAEATYTSARWATVTSHATNTLRPGEEAVYDEPNFAVSTLARDRFATMNWNNLQSALSNDFPVFEILQVASSAEGSSTITITLDADYALSPLGLNTGMGPHSPMTEDNLMPPWFCHYQCVGGVIPDSQSPTGVSPLPSKSSRATLALKAASDVATNAPVLRPLAIKAIESSSSPSGWSRFWGGVKDAASTVGDVLSGALKVGSMVGQIASPVANAIGLARGSGALGAITSGGPIVEEVMEAAAPLAIAL